MSAQVAFPSGAEGAAARRAEAPAARPPPSEDDEVSDDGLALLPRHTKVLVTGNNRTKRSLVGLKGVVKKAVGLGGWHWLVLSDGSEVRLQRNALQVLEQPTGDEEDSSSDEVTAMPRQDRATTSLQERKTHPSRRTLHERRRDGSGAALYVNFNKLQSSALKRYRRHYKLQVTPDATKDQLVNAVGAHFMSQKIDERKLLGKLIGKYSSHS